MDLKEGLEIGFAISLPSPARSSARSQGTRSSCGLRKCIYPWAPKSWSRHPVKASAVARGMETPPHGGGVVLKGVQPSGFASQEMTHCPLSFSLDAMVKTWPRLHLFTFSPIALFPGVLERVHWDRVHLLLVACSGQPEY